MHFFNFDIKKALLIIFLLILPLFLLTLDRSKTEDSFIFKLFVSINSNIQSAYHSFTSSIYNTTETYLNLIHIKKNNRKLKTENHKIKTRLTLMKEIEIENKRLKSIFKFKESREFQFIVAQVIGRDPISEYQLISINRGKKHGLKKKMIVSNETGVIGYIFRVLPRVSQVILLTDPHAVIPAIIQRSRVYGLVEGSNKNICKMKYLKARDDVKKGDIIVTSGLSNLSLAGLPIGTVTNIKKQKYDLTQEVTVSPFINSSKLEEVFILKKTANKSEE